MNGDEYLELTRRADAYRASIQLLEAIECARCQLEASANDPPLRKIEGFLRQLPLKFHPEAVAMLVEFLRKLKAAVELERDTI